MKKYLLVFLFLYILSNASFAQGYKIEVKVDGIKDTTLRLGHHYGDKKFVIDTAEINENGIAIFEGEEELTKGVYLVVLPGSTYFDVLIDTDQEFKVETDTLDFVKNMKITGSDQLQKFVDYQLFMMKQQEISGNYRSEIDTLKKDEEKNKAEIDKKREKMKSIGEDVQKYWDNIISENPDSFLATLILMMKDIEIPEPPKDEDGNITDSLFQYNYYKAHYFDNINFAEPGVLRIPVLHGKLANFFTRVIVQHPDSIIKESDKVLNKAKANEDCYQYVLQYVFNHYTQSNIMGMDKVFVHYAENYYLNGEASWADTAFLKKIEERVIKLKPNLIGQKAPDLKMMTIDGNWKLLSEVKAKFTILYFWDPDCGHCKKVTPKLHELYQKYWEKGVEVFCVFTQVEKDEWVEYIEEEGFTDWINVYDPYQFTNFRNAYDIYSTPVAYLLNENKEIIAKRVDVETLEKILEEGFLKNE